MCGYVCSVYMFQCGYVLATVCRESKSNRLTHEKGCSVIELYIPATTMPKAQGQDLTGHHHEHVDPAQPRKFCPASAYQ